MSQRLRSFWTPPRSSLQRLEQSGRETGVDSSLGAYHAGLKLEGMPELPDITAYLRALEPRIMGETLEQVRIASAFLLRTAQPPLASVEGRVVRELRRIGKRIAIGVE